MIRNLFLLIASVCVLAGCGNGAESSCPTGRLCLRAGNDADPNSLDPPKTQLTIEDNVVSDLFIGLVTNDPAGRPIPGLASRWTTSADGLTWRFKLRAALWSDGVPVTARDVVFSLRRLLDPKTASPYAALIYPIRNAEAANTGKAPIDAIGVEAPDDTTVVITLHHPTPYLLQLLKHQITYPVPEHAVRRWGDGWISPEHFVSDGPFVLKSWALGDRIRLVKNPRFYDAANVCLDEVDYYPTADATSAMRRVKRGELDLTIDAQSGRIALLRRPGQMPAYVHTATYLGTVYLAFNDHVPALHDARVRQALSMALDREFYTGKLLRAGQQPAYSFTPPGTAGYPGGVRVAWADESLSRRQAEARALLSAAGYGPGHPLTLELKAANHGDATILSPAVQADWAAVGVKVALEPEEGQIFYADLDSRNFQIAAAEWIADYNDAMSFLYLMRSETGMQNYGDYKSAAYDAAIAKADAEPDAGKRGRDMVAAESIMLGDTAVAPLYFMVSRNLVNPALTGWVDNIMDQHRKRWMCFKDARRAAPR